MANYSIFKDEEVAVRWDRNELSNGNIFIQAVPAACADARTFWPMVAVVSVPEAKVRWVDADWRNIPQLFEVVSEVCASCAAWAAA